ncbi:hypothetical protein GCM10007979_35170 [Nocardioides albus]|nr:hypothetical protein GCM10007979_35170 [Nocardioides albus]
MPFFTPRCPVSEKARDWVETSVDLLRMEFGDAALFGEVLTPGDLLAGWSPRSDLGDVEQLLQRVCARMDAPHASIDLRLTDDGADPGLGGTVPLSSRWSGEAGHYRREGDRFVVAVSRGELRTPMSLTATLAHEVGHVRLLGENRISPDQYDQEQLTDLATVVLGLGVFSANAAFDYHQDSTGWRTQRLGYLGEQLFGYALAYVAHCRGEHAPAWAAHLDTNPRTYMKQGLRYLRARDS